jgi:hypothetical protein
MKHNSISKNIIYLNRLTEHERLWNTKELIYSKISYAYARLIGDIDKPMIPYIKRINKIQGLYTLYTCAGHLHKAGEIDKPRRGYICFRAKDRERAYRILSRFEDDYERFCYIDEYPKLTIRWYYTNFDNVVEDFVTTLEEQYPE